MRLKHVINAHYPPNMEHAKTFLRIDARASLEVL